MRIFTTSRFERRLKVFLKDHPDLSAIVRETMEKVADNPFASNLKTHKLTGSLKGCLSSRITFSYRIIFILNKESVCFLDVGSHDDVY